MGTLVVAVVILSVVALFSIQNGRAVDVSFLFWSFQASLSVVIFFSVVAGAVVGVSVTAFFKVKGRKKRSP